MIHETSDGLESRVRIQFLGASRQVTGSRYLLEVDKLRLLVDCGLFQERDYRERNWAPFPVDPEKLDYILLTHCHLDHAGLLPKVVREGFNQTVFTTSPSLDLLKIVLLDSARIQEEDAAYKKKRHKKEGRKGRFPEVPLYTVADAEECLSLIHTINYQEEISLGEGVSAVFHDAGHILGAAMIEVNIQGNNGSRKVIFSGDIGQWDKPLMKDPSVFQSADYVVMESTYGDRNHEDLVGIEDKLRRIINQTVKAGGNIIIPTFAIERAQELMFHLSRLVREDKIPFLMIFLDSPMAVDVTDVFLKQKEFLDEETLNLMQKGEPPFRFPGLKLVRTIGESKAINNIKGPCIIMAGSGMCTGGRVKHHLARNISKSESTILFVGFQARGTLGRHIVNGADEVRIHGKFHKVRARIEQIDGFSAHADRDDLMQWLGNLQSAPKKVFLTHGEEDAALALADSIRQKMDWQVSVPSYKEESELE